MANILVVIPGLSLPDLCAMSPGELMRWHEKAEKRSGSETK